MKTLKDKLYVTGKELDELEEQGKKIKLVGNVGEHQILYINSERYVVEICTGNKEESYKILEYKGDID